MVGVKLKTNFRAGSDRSGVFEAFAFAAVNQAAMMPDRRASAIHVESQARGVACRAAIQAAARAVTPMATSPQPEMAVNAPARSMVSRMKRKLSIARACISGGSGECVRSKVMRGMKKKVATGDKTSKFFAAQSKRPGTALASAA